MGATKTIIVLPDFQIPYHDQKFVDRLVRFVGDFQPTEVGHTGDLVDHAPLGRWKKGLQGEYDGSTNSTLEAARQFWQELRAVHRRRIWYKLGNHDLRWEDYLAKYGPAMLGLEALDLSEPKVMDLRRLRVEAIRGPHLIAPGWLSVHGHEKKGLSQIGGQTAAIRMRQYNMSVVMGHTHRAGLVGESRGWGGAVTPRWGMEVGHGMDLSKADYVEDGSANWQQAFGILRVCGGKVYPELVVANGGRFMVEGQLY